EPRAVLPSKLIEFPRELVSSRRARPHLPEYPGQDQVPLFQEEELAPLRIFEVQPETASQPPVEQEASPRSGLPETAREATTPALGSAAPLANSPASNENASRSSTTATTHTGPATTHTGPATKPVSSAVTEKIQPRASRTSSSSPSASNPPSSRFQNSTSNPLAASSFRQLEWASISLDKEPASYRQRAQNSVAEYVPFMVDPASIDRRAMAFAVDFAAVTAAFLGFLVVFVASTPYLPTGLTAVALAGVVYVALWVLYQMLFFTLSGATAGMLYARIALCTFDDQNPSRSSLRRRLAAWWVSFLPLGIGFLWCFVDEDNLCWHDRITRMYQREY
ncbi:MAG: RDD family protein, partial [Acidobacteriaceae bacterium]